MMLLKSDKGKSIIVDILEKNTNSILYVYDKNMIAIEHSLIVDPSEISMHVLAKEIEKHMKEELENENRYDYLIIYTNCSENSVVSFYNTFENAEDFPVRDIIITCK